jgi:hypothetical protein
MDSEYIEEIMEIMYIIFIIAICSANIFGIIYLYNRIRTQPDDDTSPNQKMNLKITGLGSSSSSVESFTTTDTPPSTTRDLLDPLAYSLVNYFILSSYNSCISEIALDKTTVISLQALGNVLTNGYRLIDVELYLDLDDAIPIVASSYNTWSTNGNFSKPIINTALPLKFSEVMNYIILNAFRPGICSNNMDPLIFNLRINTYDTSIYDKIADIIEFNIQKYPELFLPSSYSYKELLTNYNNNNKSSKNALTVPIRLLKSHIIIFASALNDSYLNSNLNKYINNIPISNYGSVSPFVNINPISQFNLDDQLINYNKFNLSIAYPDNYITNNINMDTLMIKTTDANNNTIDVLNSYGIQCLGVMHYKNDTNKTNIINWFNKKTSAFVLKDKSLRDIPKVVNIQAQDPNYSFKPIGFKVTGINEKLDI